MDKIEEIRKSQLDRVAKTIFIVGTITLTIYYAGKIVIPVIFSGIVAVFLYPIVKKFMHWGLNCFFSTLITVLTATLVLIGVVFVLGYESQLIISELPDIEVGKVLSQPVEAVENSMNVELSQYDKYLNTGISKIKSALTELIPQTLTSLKNTLVFFITCPIYIFFMLLYSGHLRTFYLSLFDKKHNEERAKNILHDINGVYANYIKGMSVVILIVATLTSIGLAILGLDYPIFLGTLAGILVLIPYVGVFVSAIIPVILALVTKDSYWYAGGVILVFAVVQFLEGNLITPKIVGGQVGINPLIVIVGIIIFGAVAGIAGMIITIPVLALFKVIAEHIPSWKPLKLLLKA